MSLPARLVGSSRKGLIMVHDGSVLRMPDNFLWGAGTAAHQNEGDNGNNQWAAWEAQPGRIFEGQRCGSATGWWDLAQAEQDFDRAAELGLNSLRLSIEWSRVEPVQGQLDGAALARYSRMVDLLVERGIKPMVTLHHFTDPLWLADSGGWENDQVTEFFGRYVRWVVEALGDRVGLWCTINEPIVYAYSGYMEGYFPPGVKSLPRALRVLRRMLLSHGRAYRIIHALQNNAQVGIAHNFRVLLPAAACSAADRRATRMIDQLANGTTLEAIVHGRLVPLIGWGQTIPELIDSSDFLGLNYYTTERVAFHPGRPFDLFTHRYFDPHMELSEKTGAGKPFYITENGVPDRDDSVRPRFIATHLAEAWRAVQEGVDLRGYYHWTLVDNFEWCEGWNLRFGLIDLDPATGLRTLKTSAAIYSRIAQANGVTRQVLAMVAPQEAGKYFDGREP
jgi:beta-glucosidase